MLRVQILCPKRILDALDRWRAKHQIWSRGEAMRRIIEERLIVDGELAPQRSGPTA